MDPTSLHIPEQIETERLLLRCYTPQDAAMYLTAGLRNRDHLERYERHNSLRTINTMAESENLLQAYRSAWDKREYFMLGAFEKTSGDFVAQIYIGVPQWNLPECEIGYIADVDHQGKGYVSEGVRAALDFCFTHLKAHRVRLECDDSNTASARVAQRCGFRQEGHLRENQRQPDGTITGTLLFGLLKAEWEQDHQP
ncbi:MAG: GNAT family N-acetyltransferase [Anaerolineae bacterium]|nr:GNAT family N-acetyltransferase [Anaerolineae bacterium]